jgi:DinB family protein
MLYMQLNAIGREELLAELASMPGFLEQAFAGLSAEQITLPGPEGLFSPVKQVWHLADLEREGFAARIDRLQRETDPQLPDFDGAAVAAARDYRSLSLAAGLRTFKTARMNNIQQLRQIKDDAWTRSGTQEGVGRVSLCDIPAMIRAHDAAHKQEISRWLEGAGG